MNSDLDNIINIDDRARIILSELIDSYLNTGTPVSSKVISESLNFAKLNLTAILLSFIFSFITIKYFLKYIKKFNLNIFVFYRIILGIVLLYLAYL